MGFGGHTCAGGGEVRAWHIPNQETEEAFQEAPQEAPEKKEVVEPPASPKRPGVRTFGALAFPLRAANQRKSDFCSVFSFYPSALSFFHETQV